MTLTKSDRTKLIDEMKEVFVTKEELGTAIADLVKQLPSKKEQMADKLEILTAIKDLNHTRPYGLGVTRIQASLALFLPSPGFLYSV